MAVISYSYLPQVFVYKIPPRQSARGYRAADWSLSNPDWTGRMRVMEQNKKVPQSVFSECFVFNTIVSRYA